VAGEYKEIALVIQFLGFLKNKKGCLGGQPFL
jgi:hypothetical protein